MQRHESLHVLSAGSIFCQYILNNVTFFREACPDLVARGGRGSPATVLRALVLEGSFRKVPLSVSFDPLYSFLSNFEGIYII